MTPWTTVALAIVLGSTFAVGVLLLATRVPRWAAVPLHRRIAPYVRDVADPLGLTPLPRMRAVPDWRAARDRFIGVLGGGTMIARRLTQAGWNQSVTDFRARQLWCGLGGAAVGALAVIANALAGTLTIPLVLAVPVCAVGAALAYDLWLTTQAKRRGRRLTEELPTVLEFLALCLSAGEGLRDGLARVGAVGSGELTSQVRRALVLSGTGTPLADALTTVAREADVPPFSRAVDHLVAAIERGAPLAQVLQAQAADAREEAKRRLLEQAGHREVVMLLPLVFLILPLSVLFAIFPGVALLRLGF